MPIVTIIRLSDLQLFRSSSLLTGNCERIIALHRPWPVRSK